MKKNVVKNCWDEKRFHTIVHSLQSKSFEWMTGNYCWFIQELVLNIDFWILMSICCIFKYHYLLKHLRWWSIITDHELKICINLESFPGGKTSSVSVWFATVSRYGWLVSTSLTFTNSTDRHLPNANRLWNIWFGLNTDRVPADCQLHFLPN